MNKNESEIKKMKEIKNWKDLEFTRANIEIGDTIENKTFYTRKEIAEYLGFQFVGETKILANDIYIKDDKYYVFARTTNNGYKTIYAEVKEWEE